VVGIELVERIRVELPRIILVGEPVIFPPITSIRSGMVKQESIIKLAPVPPAIFITDSGQVEFLAMNKILPFATTTLSVAFEPNGQPSNAYSSIIQYGETLKSMFYKLVHSAKEYP
jgi:hypothetical protein